MLDDLLNKMLPCQFIGLYTDLRQTRLLLCNVQPLSLHLVSISIVSPCVSSLHASRWAPALDVLVNGRILPHTWLDSSMRWKLPMLLKGKNYKNSPSMTRQPLLVGIQCIGDVGRGGIFLTIPRSSVETWSSTKLKGPFVHQSNEKAISYGTKSYIGHKFGIPF